MKAIDKAMVMVTQHTLSNIADVNQSEADMNEATVPLRYTAAETLDAETSLSRPVGRKCVWVPLSQTQRQRDHAKVSHDGHTKYPPPCLTWVTPEVKVPRLWIAP